MEKRIYSLAFALASICVLVAILRNMTINDIHFDYTDNNIESVMEDCFPHQARLREFYGAVNRVLTPYEVAKEGGSTIKDCDGYLQPLTAYKGFDVENAVNNLAALRTFCNDRGIDFAYVSYPSKSESIDYETLYGVWFNYEEQRSILLQGLRDSDIKVLDIRDMLEAEGLTRKDIFYKTDHHWNTGAGLYGAQAIAAYLKDEFGLCTYPERLDPELFSYTEYPQSWLGETGRQFSKTFCLRLPQKRQLI